MKNNFKDRWQDMPVVAYALIVANIVMYASLFLAPLVWFSGLTSVQGVISGQWLSFLMASFNHGRLMNVILDSIILYFVGGQLERLIGHWRLLLVYLLSSLASLFTAGAFLGNDMQTITSGTAILGLFGGFLMLGDVFKDSVMFGQIARQYWILLFMTIGLNFLVDHRGIYAMVGGTLGGFLSSMALGAPGVGKINPLNRVVSGLIYICTLILFVFMGMNH